MAGAPAPYHKQRYHINLWFTVTLPGFAFSSQKPSIVSVYKPSPKRVNNNPLTNSAHLHDS